jgi:hypothetical protein
MRKKARRKRRAIEIGSGIGLVPAIFHQAFAAGLFELTLGDSSVLVRTANLKLMI